MFFNKGTSGTTSGGVWSKVAGGIGSVFGGVGKLIKGSVTRLAPAAAYVYGASHFGRNIMDKVANGEYETFDEKASLAVNGALTVGMGISGFKAMTGNFGGSLKNAFAFAVGTGAAYAAVQIGEGIYDSNRNKATDGVTMTREELEVAKEAALAEVDYQPDF